MTKKYFIFYLFLWLFTLTISYGQVAPKVATLTKAKWESYPTLLLGKWQSLKDPKSFLVITKNSYQEVYGKEQFRPLTYKLTNTSGCPTPDMPKYPDQARDILVTYDAADQTFYCYGITLLTKTRLTLTYPGRGDNLIFKRIQQLPR